MGRIPAGILDRIERTAAHAQGKGFGAISIEHEVDAIRTLVPQGVEVRTVVDIGAHFGLWTMSALATFPAAHVHAFEPSTTCQRSLVRRYRDDPRVTLNTVALSDERGSGTLYSDQAGSGLASLTRRRLDHVGVSMDLEERVEVSTLDDYVAAAGIDRVDVVKIDVEGQELGVLRGAVRTLETTSVVQFEFGGTAIDSRTYFRDYWYFLTDAGFDVWRIGPWGVGRIKRYRETDEHYGCTNYLGVRTA